MNFLFTRLLCVALVCNSFPLLVRAQSADSQPLPAWHDGKFVIDVTGLLGRSDIVLGHPNLDSSEAVPLGNGHLGVAIWSEDGLTAQLDRNDTLPDRLSAGKVVIPGLSSLTRAKDYAGRLDLYRGEFREEGGGMKLTAYVEPGTDALVIDVSGADPNEKQTAILNLWSPRTPRASVRGSKGMLAQTWVDDKRPEASGRTFGSLAAITAEGRDVVATVNDPLTITVSFKPFPDGHFHVIAAAPHYDGKIDADATAALNLSAQPDTAHVSWWRDFWNRAALIKLSSADGSGEYMENLRNLYLYVAAIEKGYEYPGSQAGIADMISSARDEHRWDPSAFWHWNLRMLVAANIGAGLPELNDTYFNLFRENLASIEDWTKRHMSGHPGVCVPETMRFNGRGIEYEGSWTPASIGNDCDADFKPYYNARTISTGAEISLWIWQQYLATNDRKFLADNYPVMAASARFLLAYQKPGTDRLLHTHPSNAHETQWDVTDPTTDLAAIKAFYPATIQAAELLGKDNELVKQLKTALPKIPDFPRVAQTGPRTLVPASDDSKGTDVIAESWVPGAEDHNIENIGLEPVWPYDLIGDSSPLFALARRTYAHRPNSSAVDWSFDPIQAARLGLASEVGATLIKTTEKFQGFINGMAKWEPSAKEFYVEQTGVLADALQEALVQDYDGIIRIAPAIPPGWDFDGSVYVRGRTKVDVQTRNGVVTGVVIEAGTTGRIKVRNPWPGAKVDIVAGKGEKAVLSEATDSLLQFAGKAGTNYLLRKHTGLSEQLKYAPVSGIPATSAKRLGPVQIGLFP